MRVYTERDTMSSTSGRSSLDDVVDAYKPGIDVTLIDVNLRRSVDERLANLQRFLEFAENFGARARRRGESPWLGAAPPRRRCRLRAGLEQCPEGLRWP